MLLKDKHILLGISAGIAAYKAANLTRLLVKEGAQVQVVMTPNATDFITPITLSALSNKPVFTEPFDKTTGAWNSHIDLALNADLMLIAPATANTIAKMAAGIADNLLLTTYLATRCPVTIAPAMDLDMYQHSATQANLAVLMERGVNIIEPASGFLASGLQGKGRMQEPEVIRDEVIYQLYHKDCTHLNVLITAGPTYEKLDPVRYIGNFSSGKMGYAIADELLRRGASVTLISGPTALTPPKHCNFIQVESAEQMHKAAVEHFPNCNTAILAAAVADFKPTYSDQKIKRKEQWELTLTPNPDIAAELGSLKTDNQKLIGFALESNDGYENACNKLQSKNLDLIILNSLQDYGAGFQTDTNKITIIDKDKQKQTFPLKPKKYLAKDIINAILEL